MRQQWHCCCCCCLHGCPPANPEHPARCLLLNGTAVHVTACLPHLQVRWGMCKRYHPLHNICVTGSHWCKGQCNPMQTAWLALAHAPDHTNTACTCDFLLPIVACACSWPFRVQGRGTTCSWHGQQAWLSNAVTLHLKPHGTCHIPCMRRPLDALLLVSLPSCNWSNSC